MSDSADAAETFDIHVQQLAWGRALIALDRKARAERGESAHPLVAQDAADSGARQADATGNRMAR